LLPLWTMPPVPYSGVPMPAAFKSSAVGFPLLQQSRTFPFTTTVGTEVTSYSLALSIPPSFKLYTVTSQLEHDKSCTRLTVSSHSGQPATNTSTLLFSVIDNTPLRSLVYMIAKKQAQSKHDFSSRECRRPGGPRELQRAKELSHSECLDY
jgi:hypothetical protein